MQMRMNVDSLVIVTMSAAWHGGIPGAEQWVNNPTLAAAISSAMDYWFENDFTVAACLDEGGTDECPCGTPGLWNSNWFSNVRYSTDIAKHQTSSRLFL